MAEDEVDRRRLEDDPAHVHEERVLLRHAVEAPGVVLLRRVEVELLLHPLSAPHAGVEVGHHAERTRRGDFESAPERRPRHHLRLGSVRVEDVVHPVVAHALVSVERTPVGKEAALVETKRVLARVVIQPVGEPSRTEALLNLPARHVGVHVDVAFGTAHRRRHTIDEHDAPRRRDLRLDSLDLRRGEVVFHPSMRHHGEHTVVALVRRQHRTHLVPRLVCLARLDHRVRPKCPFQRIQHLVFPHAMVEIHAHHAR